MDFDQAQQVELKKSGFATGDNDASRRKTARTTPIKRYY